MCDEDNRENTNNASMFSSYDNIVQTKIAQLLFYGFRMKCLDGLCNDH